MRGMIVAVCSLGFLLALTVDCVAQSGKKAKSGKDKISRDFEKRAKSGGGRGTLELTKKTDKKGTAVYVLGPVQTGENSNVWVLLTAVFEGSETNPKMTLAFSRKKKEDETEAEYSYVLYVDGEKKYGGNSGKQKIPGNEVAISVKPTLDVLETLGSANLIEGKLSDLGFAFDEKLREAFKKAHKTIEAEYSKRKGKTKG